MNDEKADFTRLREIQDPRVGKVAELLAESPRHSVAELALQVHLSPSRLSKLFKSEAGIGLGQYLTLLRMRCAARLLATTEDPVKKIAAAVGYHHPSSFVRAFNEHFSESPKVYRLKLRRAAATRFLQLDDLLRRADRPAADDEQSGGFRIL